MPHISQVRSNEALATPALAQSGTSVGFSVFHSKYLASRITLEGHGDEALTQSLSAARVDMNPHQVDAALFALHSPLSNGVILADEVGLGKTIEGLLVIAQLWSERKRRILLVVPASLRKQWGQELRDKLSLRSIILDARTYRDLEKAGQIRPFDAECAVVITSYEFAARRAAEIKSVAWDLVIFDEAHRLRNVYKKGGSKRAKELKDALATPFKLLLTATPLQNSLMELYGLVSIIDDQVFGDEKTFKIMYASARADAIDLLSLKQRLVPICRRTLRREVQQAGHINYTNRISRTFDFEPADQETELYDSVSNYLKRKDSIAFGSKPNQLITMVARKTLGSSTFAISEFLAKVIARLKAKLPLDESVLEDVETGEVLAEELDEDAALDADGEPIDPQKLKDEIAELQAYRELALSIGSNAKGEKLIAKLPEILDEIHKRNGRRKAVIFTESVRTQRYLNEVLGQNGYGGQIVLMNGSNADAVSKQLYAGWLQRHKGTDAVSGAKSADMKAAIVEAFNSDDKTILIATESGAEGINLQFCSLVINYDLPWNPQRVEQRIGRCHRYGQKTDVSVVNLLNRKNRAEARVYELLEEKFRLFEGVFGASDEVLGIIERGIDFEKKVLEIVQCSRTDAEIEEAFNKLQSELQSQIDEQMLDARRKLLENMDADVVSKLRMRKESLDLTLSTFEQRLVAIAKAELPEAKFHTPGSPRFDYDGKTWTTEWPLADERGWQFFRLAEGTLAYDIVERAKARQVATSTVRFCYDTHRAHGARFMDVEGLTGKAGWLSVSKLTINSSKASREHLIAAGVADDGAVLEGETVDRLFLIPAETDDAPDDPIPIDQLDALSARTEALCVTEAERENMSWLEEKTEQLYAYADDVEKAAEAEIKSLEVEIKAARKAIRGKPELTLADKLAEQRRIAAMEGKRDELRMESFARKKGIQREVDGALDEMAKLLAAVPKREPLFTIRWEVR